MVKENKKLPLKIVLTGPESSGKTTLAQDLARALNTDLVPEFARLYLQYLGRPYRYPDLASIYTGQKAWQHWHLHNCKMPVLVCDTDWTVIRIWELFQYGTIDYTADEKPAPNTHYFLCVPDMPWTPDPLRENPAERDVLFELYRQLLVDTHASFNILHGDAEQRLKTALKIIPDFF